MSCNCHAMYFNMQKLLPSHPVFGALFSVTMTPAFKRISQVSQCIILDVDTNFPETKGIMAPLPWTTLTKVDDFPLAQHLRETLS